MQIHINFYNRVWRCHGGLFLIYCLLLILLCGLGFWQLQRAEQKKMFLDQQHSAINAAVVNLNELADGDASALRYHNAIAVGYYDTEHQFLLDNQILNGKPGYFVLTPFVLDNGMAILVNRGWLPVGNDRRQIPDVQIFADVRQISGRINQFPGVGIKLEGAEIPTANWPALVQLVDVKVLAARLSYPLYDFQIELDANAAAGYARQWHAAVIMPPEKHIAYAVQWFGLALTLTILFFWKTLRKSS